jgi:hypothetical protein
VSWERALAVVAMYEFCIRPLVYIDTRLDHCSVRALSQEHRSQRRVVPYETRSIVLHAAWPYSSCCLVVLLSVCFRFGTPASGYKGYNPGHVEEIGQRWTYNKSPKAHNTFGSSARFFLQNNAYAQPSGSEKPQGELTAQVSSIYIQILSVTVFRGTFVALVWHFLHLDRHQ